MMRRTFMTAALIAAICLMAHAQFDAGRKLNLVEQIIENYYVDSVKPDEMAEKAIVAMLETLDPHSTYTNAKETKELTEPLQGNFSGIGIQFQMLNDTLYVIATTSGGPSEKVGILAGDRILSADTTMISGVKRPNSEVMKILRGPKGSEINVKVLRKGEPEPIDFLIIRDDIPIYSVDAAYMADENTGYIRVSRFAETTADEVSAAMKKLRKKGMKDLLIDLEDNGGGYLNSAFRFGGMFLPRGASVVYTEGLRQPKMTYDNEEDGDFLDGNLIVMVNQYSASASEILAGAIQDNDRGVIVGRRTFGKGLVQRPFPMPDGSMIRLTTARYHTPSGRCIQKPYTKGDAETYHRDMLYRYESGEFTNADSVHFADSLLCHTLNLKRPVYGGGGIMPDRFVAVDTTFYSNYYRDLLAKGVINKFVVNYIDSNRKQLKKKYADEENFVEKFKVTPDIMQGLIDLGEKDGVAYNAEQYATSRKYLETIVKALIGRDLFEQSTYYRVANELNPVYREALKLINDPAAYRSILTTAKDK